MKLSKKIFVVKILFIVNLVFHLPLTYPMDGEMEGNKKVKVSVEHNKMLNDDEVKEIEKFLMNGFKIDINKFLQSGKLDKLDLLNKKLTDEALSKILLLFTQSEKYTEMKSALQQLRLIGNQLTTLPESIGLLGNLQTLSLSNNQLSELPESIGQLSNLQTLSLYDNRLTALPESIGQLSKLKQLSLHDNRLTALPKSILIIKNAISSKELFSNLQIKDRTIMTNVKFHTNSERNRTQIENEARCLRLVNLKLNLIHKDIMPQLIRYLGVEVQYQKTLQLVTPKLDEKFNTQYEIVAGTKDGIQIYLSRDDINMYLRPKDNDGNVLAFPPGFRDYLGNSNDQYYFPVYTAVSITEDEFKERINKLLNSGVTPYIKTLSGNGKIEVQLIPISK